MSEGGQIKVLIVDDIPETCDYLSKLLHFERDIQVVGTGSSGREGVERTHELRPDVVLMDINMPDMDGIAATEKIMEVAPGTQVIIMSVQGEQDYLRRAMLAGASDFLVKPFSGDDLANSIRQVFKRRPRVAEVKPERTAEEKGAAMGRVISVFSPKGGVGCTTLVVNLAVALKLEQPEKRVAIMDGSLLFGDVGVLMDMRSERTINGLVSRFDQLDADLLSDVMVTHSSGVKVLQSPLAPQQAELVSADHVRSILQLLQRNFHYVFVDTWSSFQERVLTILDLSERIVLVTTLEMSTIKNVKLFLEVAELLQYPPGKIVLVANYGDARQGIPVREVSRNLRFEVSATISTDGRAVTNSVNRGVPLVLAEPGNPVAKDIQALLQQLLIGMGIVEGEDEEESADKRRGGLLGRLRRE
ncbi:MAG: response regulator [Chloroflexia bacterium]|nr:response regulator [Chloroflexia bacterium]